MDGPSFPAPPDPVATANAQGQINADTARLTQRMNLVDQVGPGYSIRYSRLGPDGTGTGVGVGGQAGQPGTQAQPYYGTNADGALVNQGNFNAEQYLAANTDVRDALASGGVWAGKTPWDHYAQYGAAEGRALAPGAAPNSTQPAAHKLNLSGIDWSNANGVADMAYMGLPDKTQWDQIRKNAGFDGQFGGGAFETWLKDKATYDQQVDYINALAGKGADADYIRTLIGQLDNAPGLTNPYAAENVDRWQQSIALDPQQQALWDQNQSLKQTVLGLAQGQANRVGTALQTPLDTQGLPALVGDVFGLGSVGGNADLDNGSIDPWAGLADQASFDALRRDAGYEGEFGGGRFETWLAQQNQGTKNRYLSLLRGAGADPDYLRQLGATPDPLAALDTLRGRATGALYDRLQPQLDRNRIGLETRLANQGVAPGSEAWRRAMDDLGRAESDTRLAVEAQGGDEVSRLFALALQNADLANAARGQGLQERAYLQNTPINQITALMSGSQVQLPQAAPPPSVGVNPANYMDAVYRSADIAQEQAKARNDARAQTMGSLFGLPTAALGFWGL